MKALLVTDEPIVGRSLVKQLEPLGYQCELVGTGREAIAWLERGTPELLVVEWFLPDVDGTEVIRELRRRAHRRSNAIILCAVTEPAARIHARNCGADAYLPKPFAPEALEPLVKKGIPAVGGAPASLTAQQRSILASPFWQEFGREAGRLLSDFFGQTLEVATDLPGAPESMRVSASLEMLDPTALLEVKLALGCSRVTAANLARAIAVESEDENALREMLSEACNVLLGRAKTAFRPLGLRFTLALPGAEGRARAEVTSQVTVTLSSSSGLVRASLGARPSRRTLVRCTELTVGMILAQELKDAAGEVVLPAGTRLTSRDVDHLAEAFPLRQVLVTKTG